MEPNCKGMAVKINKIMKAKKYLTKTIFQEMTTIQFQGHGDRKNALAHLNRLRKIREKD